MFHHRKREKEGGSSMNKRMWWQAVVVTLVALAGVAVPAQGQGQVMWDAGIGVAFPQGTLGDYVKEGPSFQVEFVFPLSSHLSWMVGTNVDRFPGAKVDGGTTPEMPAMTLYRWQGGLEADLLDEISTRWRAQARAGVGGALIDTDDFLVGRDVNEFRFSWSAGFALGYQPSERVSSHLRGEVRWTPVGSHTASLLGELNPGRFDELTSTLAMPITLSVRFHT
jgi:hypothetical protein